MKNINEMNPITIHSGSVVTTKLRMFYKEQELSVGTGFFYELNQECYFITNWHNVTGRNPQNRNYLSENKGLPDRIKFILRKQKNIGMTKEFELLLYQDAEEENPEKPTWLIHPNSEEKIDVVAIRVLPSGEEDFHCVNKIHTTPDMQLMVSDEVFILGYPKGIDGGVGFPIWKRASIATEPDININDLPCLLVDTATREGMSGAPVIAKKIGSYIDEKGTTYFGKDGSKFIGIYSGRLGASEMEAQLGIVWKASVIDEIILGGKIGESSFDM